VMTAQKINRTKWLHLRLKPDEYNKLHKHFSKTTCNKISDYCRQILFSKPVTVLERNQSLDDFMAEMILLRNQLNAIGNNFNQAVKKLHTLDQIAQYKSWIEAYERDKKQLLNMTNEIQNSINKIADKWLQ
jgi:hypothetical protein